MSGYCEIIIDIAHANVDRLFTYRVPDALDVAIGHHVLVPFGNGNRPKEGFVVACSETFGGAYAVKSVARILEPYTVVLPEQIALARWMQKSYNCLFVDALRLMIPAQLRGERVHEKTERTVRVAPDANVKDLLAALVDQSGKIRAPRQHEVLTLLSTSGLEMRVSDILAFIPGSGSAIAALIRRGCLTEGAHVTFRRPSAGLDKPRAVVSLSRAQRHAVDVIEAAMADAQGIFLLHGVTGSGKTEVYMHCIERCLAAGRQAIMLVPEISLTPQTVGLFRARFGDGVAVLHSRLSVGERFDEWRRIRLGKAGVVVGARSAVMAPLTDIGLIVVDEEHETSYQSDTAPRYHAVDVAAYRAKLSHATLLLGSATPSLLSYFRAQSGRYTLLELPERILERPMPTVEIVDMREEFLSGNNGVFSMKLKRLLEECLKQGKQAMLFINRRGYSTFVSCRACGYVVQCPNCDISMTYHKAEGCMRCHFCGASMPLPRTCPSCGKPFIKYFGVGTEQVEEQLLTLFPDVRTLRMDTDTMRGKDSMQQLLAQFAVGTAQVLVGTQMIAKGHDFPNVTLVGVIAADATLCIPDYRSTERTFQLLTQVSGRAGRDESPGRVVIQTYSPTHPAIRYAKSHDYKSFFAYELSERKRALFPPYSLFVRILFTGLDEDALAQSCSAYGIQLESALRAMLGNEGAQDLLLFCTSSAPIRKKRGCYRYQILIKLLRTARTAEAIRLVYAFVAEHRSERFAMVEINPQDML